MKFEKIHSLVGHVPFISKENAQILYDHILKYEPENILELGIAHGTATCYMAAALEELGKGTITSVDLKSAAETYKPSAEDQLKSCGLEKYAQVLRYTSGYTWFLHDAIETNTHNDVCQPVYDLCIIDGPKNWTIDGAAFFFVDKLLRKDGWIIFDDYHWSYASADLVRDSTDGIAHNQLGLPENSVIPHQL